MGAALVAERVADPGCIGERRPDRGVLHVEDPERAGRALLLRLVVERVDVLVEPLLEPVDVRGAAVPVADRVQLELPLRHAEPAEHLDVEVDHLGVDRRIVRADRLDGLLPVLAVAVLLRGRVAVHRALGVELHRLRLAVHAVLEVRAADRRGCFGPQRERPAAAVFEGVHLLLHDVGPLPGRSEEELGVLEDGGLDTAVAEGLCDLCQRRRCELPERLLGGEDVVRAARRLELHCGAERSSARNGLCSSSRPRVVAGPCPEYTTVSGG